MCVCVCLKDHPAVLQELDLVEEDDQFTHMLTLDDAVDSEDMLSEYSWPLGLLHICLCDGNTAWNNIEQLNDYDITKIL